MGEVYLAVVYFPGDNAFEQSTFEEGYWERFDYIPRSRWTWRTASRSTLFAGDLQDDDRAIVRRFAPLAQVEIRGPQNRLGDLRSSQIGE